MKSYNSVYKKEREISLNEHKAAVTNDRARLIAAMKHEYGINDFASLNETEKAMYKTAISEMWSPETGLNEKGIAFINEAMKPLTSASTPEMIDKYIKKNLENHAEEIFKDLANNKNPECLTIIKNEVEKSTGKKIKVSEYKTMIGNTIINKVLKKKIAEIKF